MNFSAPAMQLTSNGAMGTSDGSTITSIVGNEGCGTYSFNGQFTEVSFTGPQLEWYCDFSVGIGGTSNMACSNLDTDNDAIPNRFDLDSDNDGYSDAYESGATTSTTTNYTFAAPHGTNGYRNSLETILDNGSPNYTSTYSSKATNSAITPLPVTWLEFAARKINKDDVLLNWATATEKNNLGFEVQHSPDGIHFENIGFVQGKGTTQQQHNYQFTQKNLASGTHYYRLKQLDNDGTVNFSIIRSLVVAESTLKVFPNPNNGTFTISDDEVLGPIKLYDALGQVLYSNIVNDKTYSINLENLTVGAYLLTVGERRTVLIKK